jgi:hypothetical protein
VGVVGVKGVYEDGGVVSFLTGGQRRGELIFH